MTKSYLLGLIALNQMILPTLSYSADVPASLQEWIKLGSGTSQVAAVRQVQELMAARLKEMGFSLQWLSGGDDKKGHLLVADLPGKKPELITFLAHADTVFESNSEFKGVTVSSDGLTATGPGIIDNKGGAWIALEGISTYLKQAGASAHPLRVVISPSEETGSNVFLPIFGKLAADAWLVLGFEPALEDGSVIASRRGNRWYHVQVKGREAHAGRAHREGINACVELSRLLTKISALTDYTKEVTLSVGHIEGGKDKYNIVCGAAEAKIDFRFAQFSDRDRVHAKIEAILKSPGLKAPSDGMAPQTIYEIVDDCPPFSAERRSLPLVERYLKSIKKIEGGQPQFGKSGGAADANYFSRPGVIVIDGLGPVGGKMHTSEEFARISTFKTRALALAEFLAGL